MQINLPDDPRIPFQASSAGFETVEAYVRHLIEQDAEPLETEEEEWRPLSYAEWKAEFDAFLSSLKPSNPNVDDSRESIYPVR